MPFDSAKQEAYMWHAHPDIARRWVHEHGHAKGWKDYQKNVIPRKRRARRRKGAAIDMPKLTYSQVVDEALAALDDGQLDMAGDLFVAAMSLRFAETCEACGGKKKRVVWTCRACNARESEMGCESCMSRQGGRACRACGGKMACMAEGDADNVRAAAKLKYETRKKMKDKSFACPSSHPKVKDDKDHFPIQDLSHGRNAMSRVNQYSSAPPWWGGSLAELKNTVSRAVHSRYPALAKRTEEKTAAVRTAADGGKCKTCGRSSSDLGPDGSCKLCSNNRCFDCGKPVKEGGTCCGRRHDHGQRWNETDDTWEKREKGK